MSLPDDFNLPLNAYELGMLTGWLMKLRDNSQNEFEIVQLGILIGKLRAVWLANGNRGEIPIIPKRHIEV